MEIFITVLLLVFGFVLLIKGADFFVDGASSIAQNLNMSKLFIGLTVVAFGTSAPELAIGINDMMSQNGDILLSNIMGSSILNVLLNLGISATIYPLTVKNNTVKREIPINILITLLFVVLMADNLFDSSQINQISRSDGFVLILFFSVFIFYLISYMRNKKEVNEAEEPKYNLKKSIIFTIIGIIAMVIGSDFVVNQASSLAKTLGMSERMITLLIVVPGTSLPELVTCVNATIKRELDIVVGNIVGGNIFNIGFVLAIPVILFGNIVPSSFSYIDLAATMVAALMLFLFSVNNYRITRREGIAMLAVFVLYYTLILI